MSTPEPYDQLIGKPVVLDTAGTIVYIGTLREVTPTSFVLQNADLHDCRDGHANKESYIAESARDGVSINRRNIIIARPSVLSMSLLKDVVIE